MKQAATVITEIKAFLGEDKVLTDRDVLKNADGFMVRRFEKAFGYEPEHLPICVVKVSSTQEASMVLKYCNDSGVNVIPKLAETSGAEDSLVVVNDNTLFLDMMDMDQLFELDEENMTARTGCGMFLAKLEEIANARGLTTGHCPQSQPLACMGGLVATRSIGQFSTYYGGIEDMVCGLEAVMPDGEIINIRAVPRRAAGPDLRHLFIGSEGALAVITEVTVKLFTYYPDDFWKGAFVVDNFLVGIDAVREIMVKGYRPSVVRLYDKADMDLNYGSVELKEDQACMFFVAEGPPEIARVTGEAIEKIALSHEATPIGTKVVDHWLATRNNYCNTIGREAELEEYRQTRVFYATMEISANWGDIKKIYHDVMEELPKKIDNLVALGGHISHSYQTGTNIYFVYQIKATDPLTMTENDQWKLIEALCLEVLKQETGGIVHHHGVGKVRVKMIKEELGSSYPLMKKLKDMMDPMGIMNPGTLLPLK